jgi:hypothetical protein
MVYLQEMVSGTRDQVDTQGLGLVMDLGMDLEAARAM